MSVSSNLTTRFDRPRGGGDPFGDVDSTSVTSFSGGERVSRGDIPGNQLEGLIRATTFTFATAVVNVGDDDERAELGRVDFVTRFGQAGLDGFL